MKIGTYPDDINHLQLQLWPTPPSRPPSLAGI